jgi:hypothetical protein
MGRGRLHVESLARVVQNEYAEDIAARIDAQHDVSLRALQVIHQWADNKAVCLEHVRGKHIPWSRIEAS